MQGTAVGGVRAWGSLLTGRALRSWVEATDQKRWRHHLAEQALRHWSSVRLSKVRPALRLCMLWCMQAPSRHTHPLALVDPGACMELYGMKNPGSNPLREQAFWQLKEHAREARSLEAADAHAARTLLCSVFCLWRVHADASRAHSQQMAAAAATWAVKTQSMAFAMWTERTQEQRWSRGMVRAQSCLAHFAAQSTICNR